MIVKTEEPNSRILFKYSYEGFWTLYGDDDGLKRQKTFENSLGVDYRFSTIAEAMTADFPKMNRYASGQTDRRKRSEAITMPSVFRCFYPARDSRQQGLV